HLFYLHIGKVPDYTKSGTCLFFSHKHFTHTKKSAKRPPIGEESTSPTEESSNQAIAWFCVGNITEVFQCVAAAVWVGANRADGAWS
ncbi:hypothetical protein, partial [Anoxybacillus sp. MB8]|uniref:hypothetical protein n=1 Tax=Anoxybacillus sp. MB8 TaxID=2496850 RepID=UPI001969D29C